MDYIDITKLWEITHWNNHHDYIDYSHVKERKRYFRTHGLPVYSPS
jgi:hypothetical protein